MSIVIYKTLSSFFNKKGTENVPLRGLEKNCWHSIFFLVLKGRKMWLNKLRIGMVPAQHLHSRSRKASQNQNCISMGCWNPRPKSLVVSHYHQQMDCPLEWNSYPISSGLCFDSGLKIRKLQRSQRSSGRITDTSKRWLAFQRRKHEISK